MSKRKRKVGVILTVSIVTSAEAHSTASESIVIAGKPVDWMVASLSDTAVLARFLEAMKRGIADDLALIGKVLWMESRKVPIAEKP